MATDPLDFIVALLQSRAVRSKIVAGGGQWSIRKPRYTDPSFCVMLDGACWFHPQGGDATELREGDFLLLPETPRFVLASDPALPPMDVPIDAEGDAAYGDSAPTMRMLGGYFQFDRANAELVARLLPPVILIRRGQPGAARLGRIVELIAEEAGEHNRCRDLILERLVEVLLIEAWRFETEHASAEKGLLGGLADPALSGVLRALHADLAGPWTVEKLARTAGMSRAVFAERFARTVGIPPMQYLTEWRVARAKELLLDERPALSAVAGKVGYSSASAFSAAFTRVVGCSPAAFAKHGYRGAG
ncbi:MULTISPECIES: AraC family transcriptional regulator [Mycolicibacterium]|uniref:AraC family transcriptional regulator n=1 Tax=Mycolicibacterium phocaicum TaxID=319706 RepID=A0A7I7ZR96_9MYCO|nr:MULTISPECIES: AraC family transcriptional regulator [Mycolicibacterium]RUP31476.1 MAG: AraC family transcriptional regulator [Mycolicibacterium sp.]TLH59458.1 AraC family transcriptional regulator [Mycolicibacterium phocaicum]BBZ56778.1 AraC family transcriptional regulator [Mycolicibacterium phocaicum]SHV91727.1 helix-turn-helix domain-containing protein [Mycobacteroides abscessus subsp. abscessus]